MIVGLAGAVIAVGILVLGKVTIVDPLAETSTSSTTSPASSFVPLVAMLIASAIVVSALGSGVTLRRFLRV